MDIEQITPAGLISTAFGTTCIYGGDGGPARLAGLNNPTGMALTSLGNILIADAGNHRIRQVSFHTIVSHGQEKFNSLLAPAVVLSTCRLTLPVLFSLWPGRAVGGSQETEGPPPPLN